MIDGKSFNKKISELENLNGSNASQTIKLIKTTNSFHNDFYVLLDDFCYSLGLGFMNIPIYRDGTTDKLLGYIPTLKFYPENVFNEESLNRELCSNYLDIKASSALLAKETLYQIMRFDDLEEFIIKKFKAN